MKTIIVYYSYSGNTRELAQKKAIELGADIIEVKDKKRPCPLKAYTVEIYRTIKRSKAEIETLNVDFSIYDKIIIMSPVWASLPVTPINNIIEMLPEGKKVELIMVSGGGGSKKTAGETKKLIEHKGCEVVSYIDLFAKRKKGELICEELNEK